MMLPPPLPASVVGSDPSSPVHPSQEFQFHEQVLTSQEADSAKVDHNLPGCQTSIIYKQSLVPGERHTIQATLLKLSKYRLEMSGRGDLWKLNIFHPEF